MKFVSALLLVLLTSCIDRGKGHAVGSARIELAQIQGSIEMCAIERPVQLREIFEQGEAGFLNRYYQFASGTHDSLVSGNPDWERAHTYIDPWGTPYKIKITPQGTNQYKIIIWSCGPNGNDEAGKGDDVALQSFNITIKALPR